MDDISRPQSPTAVDIDLLRQVQQNWNSGAQAAAVDLLRPRAEEGEGWAAAFMAWLTMQQGYPAILESIDWAIRAADLGAPYQAIHTFNNAVANISNDPSIAKRLPELLERAMPWYGAIDFVGQSWQLISQGQSELAFELLNTPAQWPRTPEQLASYELRLRTAAAEVGNIKSEAQRQLSTVAIASDEAISAIALERSQLETSAKQAGLLVRSVSSDATNALFKDEARRNAEESSGAWRFGLVVLAVAALVAVLPVALHYFGIGPEYSGFEQLGVHLVSTVALATFAGVLLARARSRDMAAQRAHDLSTAMGTMISYSNQISDPVEKQRFMTAMGQVILQAHITTSSGNNSKDESVSGMIALAAALRPSNVPSATPIPPVG